MTKRLLKVLLLFIFLLSGGIVGAQSYEFQSVLSGTGTMAEINTVAYSSNGDFIYAAGFMNETGTYAFSTLSVTTPHAQNGILIKFTSTGTPVWAIDIGHNGTDAITAIAVDALDNVIIGGDFEGNSSHFEGTSGGVSNLNSTGGKDVFIAKYNSSGVLQWLRQGTSPNDDFVHDIEVDQLNDIYVAGSSEGIFDVSGSSIVTSNGNLEGFALKINSLGTPQWINSAGTSLDDEFTAVTVFGGSAYFGGYYKGNGVGKLGSLTSLANVDVGASEIMIAQYNAATGADVNAIKFGGAGTDEIQGMTNDGSDLYFSGITTGNLGIGIDNYANLNQEIIVAKLDNGLVPLWSTASTHSSAGDANGWDIEFAGSGVLVVAGDYSGGLNTGYAIAATTPTTDGIVIRYQASNGNTVGQTLISGSNVKSAKSLSAKSSTEIYVGGMYRNNTVFTPIVVPGSNGFNQPFVGLLACTTGNATATLTGDGSVCSGASTDLTFTFTGDAPYSFSYDDGSNNMDISNVLTPTYTISVNPATTTTYTLTAFSSGSCTSTFSGAATVTVVPGITNNIAYGDTTHCGPSGSVFTGSVPAGASGGGLTYQWQYFSNSSNWVGGLNTNNLQGYTSTNDNVTRQYRRRVDAPGCGTSFSNVVVATIVPVITNNSVSGDQQSCGDFDPISFTVSSPGGGTGSFNYTWESDTDPNFLTPTTVGTNGAYNPPVQTQTLYFRRIVESSACFDTTGFITVEVDPVITNNTVSTDETICGPGTPSGLTGLAASGGDGSYSYVWQSSTDDITWTNVGAAQNYSPGSLSTTTSYRRYVISGLCSDTSNKIVITVDVLITGNTITPPAFTTICSGSTAGTITGTVPSGGDNSNYTFLWEMSPDNSIWGAATGINNTNDYSAPIQTSIRYYRRRVTSGSCPFTYSNTVTIDVFPPISNNTISANDTICANTAPALLTGSTPTGGDGGVITYQWESSTDNVSFNDVLLATNIDYQPGVLTSTIYYRRGVERGCGKFYSDTITITVNPLISNNVISASDTICGPSIPNPIIGELPSGGNGTYAYTWQSSLDEITWTNAAATQSFAPGILSTTTYYRRYVNSGFCSDTSNTIKITVDALITGNTITAPAPASICEGSTPDTIAGTAPTGGDNSSYTFLWEESPDNLSWGPALGTNNTITYNPPALNDTTYYRRTVTSGACAASISNVIVINVYPLISNNNIFISHTICENTAPPLLTGSVPTGGNGGSIIYNWQFSTDNVNFTMIPLSNAVNYQPGILTGTTYFRRRVERGLCGMNFSDTITITVEPAIANNTISADQLLCGTSTAATLDGSPATGGTGLMTYNWFSSLDGSTWTSLAVNNEDYTPVAITQTIYFFRTAISGQCNVPDSSNIVTITFEPAISGNTITADHSVCHSGQPDLLNGSTATGGGGPITYSWWESNDSINWVAALGITSGTDFLPNPIVDTTWYRRLATAGTCPFDTSNLVKVYVEDSIGNNILTTPLQICSNDNSGIIVGSLPINGNGSFTYVWEKSTDDINWFPILFAASQDLSIGGVSVNTYFRRIVSSGECGSDTSASVLQSVSLFITQNTIGSSQIVCYDSIPLGLIGAVQSPNTFGYSWQESIDSLSFSIASGIYDNASYQPGNADSTRFYQRIIKSGACPNDTSNIVKIEIIDTIGNNTISIDSTVCFGATGIDLPGSTPTGGDGNYLYAWESSVDNINFSPAVGLGTSNANGFTTGAMLQTTYFRRIVYNTPCSKDSIISNVVTITVQAALSANTILSDQVLCGDYTADTLFGSAVTGGSGVPDYLWQSSPDSLVWSDEAITQNYFPGTLTDTMYYRRLVTSGSCLTADTSNMVTLDYLETISSNLITGNDTICFGASPDVIYDFGINGGDGIYTYTWEQSADSIAWIPAVGTGTSFIFDADPLFDTTFFRRVLGSSVCPLDTSNSVVVFVEDSVSNNLIDALVIVCSNITTDSIMGATPIGGDGSYTYEWQMYDSITAMDWVPAPGVFGNTGQNYAIGSISDSTNFRRIVTSGQCGSDTSLLALVAVSDFVDTNTIYTDQSICMNTAPQLITGEAPTGNGFVYTWESSTDGVNFSIDLNGLFLQNIQPGTLDSTTYYRRVISPGTGCLSDTSNTITITVWDSLTNNTISNDTIVCINDGQINLFGSTIAGGSGNYAYLWEVSSDGVNFAAPTVNFNSPNYTTEAITQTLYYRRMVTDVDCVDDTLFSNTVVVDIFTPITHNFENSADTVCIGDDVNVVFQMSGDSPFSMSYDDGGTNYTVSSISLPGHSILLSPASSGLIILDTLWDVNGCYINPLDTFSYRVVAYPVVDLGIDSTVCDEYLFNPSFGLGSLEFNSPTLGALSVVFPQAFEPSIYGTHEFILTETVENCASSDTVVITFEESIGFFTAGDDQSLVLQDSTQLLATDLLPNQTGYWTLISGGGNFADTIDPNTTFLNLISGVTVLEWTIEQDVCPSASDQVLIIIQNLLVPTGFSPNNDGDNDYLEVAGREDINIIHVQVFDRWGGLVFEDKNYKNDWYGTAKSGEDLPEDTYFVIIDLGDKGIHKSYLMIRR